MNFYFTSSKLCHNMKPLLRNWTPFMWKEINFLSINGEKKKDAHMDSSSRPNCLRRWQGSDPLTKQRKQWLSGHCAGTKAAHVVDEQVILRNKTRQSLTTVKHKVFSPLPCNPHPSHMNLVQAGLLNNCKMLEL